MGLRPGYAYRFELSNLPYAPGKLLYPEVEVRGALVPRPGMKYMDYPIPLTFSAADIERALKGAVITKVIYLEDPDKAVPAEVGPNAPVEMPDGTEEAAVKAALHPNVSDALQMVISTIPFPEGDPLHDRLKNVLVDQGLWHDQQSKEWFKTAEDPFDEDYFGGVVMMAKPLHYAGHAP